MLSLATRRFAFLFWNRSTASPYCSKSDSSISSNDFLDPSLLGFAGKQEITAQHVHDRLHLIHPAYAARSDWKDLALKYPAVFYLKDQTVKRIVSMLVEDDVVSDRSVILQNLWVLLFAPQVLKEKIAAVRLLAMADFSRRRYGKPPVLPDWFKMSLTAFSEKVIYWLMRRYRLNSMSRELFDQLQALNERVDYLSGKLGVFHADIISHLDQDYGHRLILRPHHQLEHLFHMYSDVGFKQTDLRRHLWLLTRTPEGIQPRIEQLKAHKVNIKPWMLSSRSRELGRLVHQALVLNEFQTVPDVLMKKLSVDAEKIRSMCDQNLQLLRKPSILQIEKVIDYLLSEGYSEKEIADCPRALTLPLDRLKSRVQEFKSLGSRSLLSLVHKTPRFVDQLIDQLVKAKDSEQSQ